MVSKIKGMKKGVSLSFDIPLFLSEVLVIPLE